MNRHKEITALKKARGMTEKIIKMLEEDRYCIDIIQQNFATIGLLKSVNEQLLEGHLHCCFKDAMESTDEQRKEEMIQELIKMLRIAQKK